MDKYFTLKSLISQTENEDKTKKQEREMRPRRRVIDNILNYSRSLKVYSTAQCGAVRLNMN